LRGGEIRAVARWSKWLSSATVCLGTVRPARLQADREDRE
jgi:hypothetical protein